MCAQRLEKALGFLLRSGWLLVLGLAGLALGLLTGMAPASSLVEVLPIADADFGQAFTRAGTITLQRTEPTVAKFKITKLSCHPKHFAWDRTVTVALVPPSELVSSDGTRIPYAFQAAYNTATDDPTSATDFASSTQEVVLNINDGPDSFAGQSGIRYSGYVYVYGSIDVSAQPAGAYSGALTVTVSAEPGRGGNGRPFRSNDRDDDDGGEKDNDPDDRSDPCLDDD